MSQKILITVLVCLSALRMDSPSAAATSGPEQAVFSVDDDWDEHEYPSDSSEFPDADDWEVVETESKPVDLIQSAVAPVVCVRFGSSLFRESNSLLHFSLGSFDLINRLRL